jgi:hypothetical protein
VAVHKLYNAYLTVGGVDLSDHVKSITINWGAEALDSTAMSHTTRQNVGGLLTWSIQVDFLQDYAASEVDVTLQALVGTTATVVVRADAGASAATNPTYTGTGLLTSYVPVGGTVGDMHMTQATFEAGGTLVRTT